MGTFYGFEEVSGCFEASVCAVVTFGGETHGSAVGAAGVGFLVVAEIGCQTWDGGGRMGARGLRSTAVPCQSDNHRTVTAIIVIILVLQ